MTTATKKKRKWSGFACPVCRLVFRVPKEHDGKGVICPACRYLLNIPEQLESPKMGGIAPRGTRTVRSAASEFGDKKVAKPIVARAIKESDKQEAEFVPTGTDEDQKRVRRKKAPPAVAPSWDENRQETTSGKQGDPLPWILGGSVVGLIVVVLGVWVVWDNIGSGKEAPEGESALLAESNYGAGSFSVAEMAADEEPIHTPVSVMRDTEDLIKAFLTAKTWEDLKKLVSNPEVTVPRMEKWYATHEWKTPGYKEIATGGEVAIDGAVAYVLVRQNDFSEKYVAVKRTSEGYLIDWESWVGWSDMDWMDIFKKRPEEVVEVRAICRMDDYYNRLFKDEDKWVSVRLEHPDEDRSLYGYIDRNKLKLGVLLADMKTSSVMPVTLKVRFPKDSPSDNQVVIEEYIHNGWLNVSEETSPASSSK